MAREKLYSVYHLLLSKLFISKMESVDNLKIDDNHTLLRWWLEGVILPCVGAIGIIGIINISVEKCSFFYLVGNVISLYIILWTELGFKNPFRQLISILIIYDTICILCIIATFSGPLLSQTYKTQVTSLNFCGLIV